MVDPHKTRIGDILVERKDSPDLFSIESGAMSVVSKIRFAEGKIELRTTSGTKTGMILIQPGDLVLSGINAAKGAIAIYEYTETKSISATIHYSSYSVIKEKADIYYLWWFFRSNVFREILANNLPNGIKTELKANKFLPIEIPLPLPKRQKDIAEKLNAISMRVKEAQHLREQARAELHALSRTAIDSFIELGRKFKPLRFYLKESLTNGLSLPASGIGDHGMLFTKVGIVNTGKINPKETKKVNIELKSNSTFWMVPGDIFVSRGNSLELVGRAAVYEGIPERCAFSDLLIRIRVDSNLADPFFIAKYFHSRTARKYIESQASGTSPSMKKVSQPKLENMPIPDFTIIEQRRIVAYLDGLQAKVDELRRLQSESERELSALMPSILDRAFKGEL